MVAELRKVVLARGELLLLLVWSHWLLALCSQKHYPSRGLAFHSIQQQVGYLKQMQKHNITHPGST